MHNDPILIEQYEDRVAIMPEDTASDRTIHMDGRDHPASGPKTAMGHSIGRHEGRTLVVETVGVTASIAEDNLAAHYIVEERMEIAGVVTEFRAVNPHARIYFEVTNEAGQVEEWMAEGDSIISLRRAGWTDDQLKPGDRIQILGRPSRNGLNLVEWTVITLPDGTEVGGGNGQQEERPRVMETRLAEHRRQRSR